MARPDHLFVFAYDIARDSDRARVAELLLEHMVRVQGSVFEGRMSQDLARHLGHRAAQYLGPEDSLRFYCVTDPGRRASASFGAGPPIAEAQEFWLL